MPIPNPYPNINLILMLILKPNLNPHSGVRTGQNARLKKGTEQKLVHTTRRQTHTHTAHNASAIRHSYSRAGTAEVDLINLPLIQTANYTQTHNHSLHSTIKSWWGRERKTEGGKSGTERLQQAQRNKESGGHTEKEKRSSGKRKGKESGGFITSKPWTSILLESKLIFPLTYSSGLAPSQNLSEKLFVSGIPNKGINVMLMTFQPITALLMDPSVLENVFSSRTLPHGYLCHSLCQVIYGRTLSP